MANYISGRSVSSEDINLEQLMAYLKRAHDYFLDFKLPLIRRKLLDAIDIAGVDSIGFLILKFYDDFVQEVRAHMEAEMTMCSLSSSRCLNANPTKQHHRFLCERTHVNCS